MELAAQNDVMIAVKLLLVEVVLVSRTNLVEDIVL